MIFSGSKQRTGKTSICIKLAEAFKPFVVQDAEFEVLSDMQQHFQLWRDNLVLICDDLSKNDHKCLGKIKKNLSGNHFSPRIFFKQSHERMFKRATPIGTCQSTVSNTFADATGNGRFLDIPIKPFKLDVFALKEIDMVKIVKIIEPPTEKECRDIWEPLYEKYLYPHQSETVTQDIISEFIDAFGISYNQMDRDANKVMCCRKIWKDYKEFCDILGYKFVQAPNQFRQLLAHRISAEIPEGRQSVSRLPIKLDESRMIDNPLKDLKPFAVPNYLS